MCFSWPTKFPIFLIELKFKSWNVHYFLKIQIYSFLKIRKAGNLCRPDLYSLFIQKHQWVCTLQVTSYHDSPQQESANFSCKGPETYLRLCRTQGVYCKLNNSGTVMQKQPQTMCKLEWLCSNKTLLTKIGSRLDFAHGP